MTRQTEPLSQMTRFVLTVFAFVFPLMCIGWTFIAWMPLWFAPPLENAGNTLSFYFFGTGLLWFGVLIWLHHRWKKPVLRWGNVWIPVLLGLIWLVGLLLALSLGDNEGVLYIALGDAESANGDPREICHVEDDAAVNRYTCWGCMVVESTQTDDDWTFSRSYFTLGCWQYTFEGREGLPFVRRTGGGRLSNPIPEITPEALTP